MNVTHRNNAFKDNVLTLANKDQLVVLTPNAVASTTSNNVVALMPSLEIMTLNAFEVWVFTKWLCHTEF